MCYILLKHLLVGAFNIGSTDYSALTICVTVIIVCTDMFKARTIRCHQFAARPIFQAVKERYFCFGNNNYSVISILDWSVLMYEYVTRKKLALPAISSMDYY
jgi:hypothetical protein